MGSCTHAAGGCVWGWVELELVEVPLVYLYFATKWKIATPVPHVPVPMLGVHRKRANVAECSHFLHRELASSHPRWSAAFRAVDLHRPRTPRRVWSLIVFGFEIPMLVLHMRILQPVVAGFLVSEGTTTYHTVNRGHHEAKDKPAVLTEAMANGTFPADLAAITRVTVLNASHEYEQCAQRWHRGGNLFRGPQGCYEPRHYHALLELLAEVASTGDLALLGDVDEIAIPEVITMLQSCAPWWGDDATSSRFLMARGNATNATLLPHMYVLDTWDIKYGVHCWPDRPTWLHGPHVFSASWLLAHRQQLTPLQVRLTRHVGLSYHPHVHPGGWHFTSFGEPWELQRKLRTWSHADLFDAQSSRHPPPALLSMHRLELCASNCLSAMGHLEVMPTPGRNTPLHLISPSQKHEASSCERRDGALEVRLPGTVLNESDLLDGRRLPAYLLAHRAEYAAFFRYVRDGNGHS